MPALTAYDYPTARLLDEAGVPLILVGDSLGMVVLGYPDTTQVTLAEIRQSLAAVARAKTRALVVGDLPFHTYDTPEAAVTNARILVEAGAEAVKLEGGIEVVPEIREMRRAGIAVMGHIGMLPQHVKEEGGYKIRGPFRGGEWNGVLADALAIQEAGVFSIVMELVEPEAAREITASLTVLRRSESVRTALRRADSRRPRSCRRVPLVPAQVCDGKGRCWFRDSRSQPRRLSRMSEQLDIVFRGRRLIFLGWLQTPCRIGDDGPGEDFDFFVPRRSGGRRRP